MMGVGCGFGGPPSVVLITLDTTRVDHLSSYGYPRPTSPNLDRLARESVRHTRAWSTSSWTLPAHASLFTGLYPAAHGAHYDDEGDAALGSYRVGALHERFETLAEILRSEGFRTGAFIGGPWLKPAYGLMQGFETVHDGVQGLAGPPARELTDQAMAWLDQAEAGQPYFLFVNYFDPHLPYDPPIEAGGFGRWREPVRKEWWQEAIGGERPMTPAELEILVDRYDSEIRYMDMHLGRLLDAVAQAPGGDRVLVIVTADHGESFGEGGRYLHSYWLAEELTRVPLLVRHPDRRRAGEVDAAPIQLVDLLPLILEELGLEARAGVSRREADSAFMELYSSQGAVEHFGPSFDRRRSAVVTWPLKLQVSQPGGPELFQIQGLEERRVESPDAEEIAALGAQLRRYREAIGSAPIHAPEPDPEAEAALRAIGYLE